MIAEVCYAIDKHSGDIVNLFKKLSRFRPLTSFRIIPFRRIDLGALVSMPAGYRPTNPSFTNYKGQRLVCVRGVNYKLANSVSMKPVFLTGSTYHSVNRFFVMDDARVLKPILELDAIFEGAEDIRLFVHDNHVHALFSRPVDPVAGRAACEMVLAKLAPDLSSAALTQLPSPFGFAQEKNWSPFSFEGAIHFLYSFDPIVVLKHDVMTGVLSIVRPIEGAVPKSSLRFLLCGSGAAVAYDGGLMFMVHRRTVRLPFFKKIYVHRLARMDRSLGRIKFGRYLSIGREEIQFVGGLSIDDRSMTLAFGRMDSSAELAEFPLSSLKSIFP